MCANGYEKLLRSNQKYRDRNSLPPPILMLILVRLVASGQYIFHLLFMKTWTIPFRPGNAITQASVTVKCRSWSKYFGFQVVAVREKSVWDRLDYYYEGDSQVDRDEELDRQYGWVWRCCVLP